VIHLRDPDRICVCMFVHARVCVSDCVSVSVCVRVNVCLCAGVNSDPSA